MATDALKSTLSSPAGAILDGLAAAREATLALVAPLDTEQLERVHSPIMSPLVWDLGHIAAYEDLWIGQRIGEPRAAARRSGCAVRRVRDAARGARRHRGAAPRRRPRIPRRRSRAERRDARRVGARRACARDRRDGDSPRASALRDDAPDAGDRRTALAGRPRGPRSAARGRRRGPARAGLDRRAGRAFRARRRRARASPTTTSARATPRARRRSRSRDCR